MKYIELFKNGFDETIAEKVKPENYPYVGYSPSDGLKLSMTPEDNQIEYQMVDLGLPSGLKWADRNVGASSPEDAGLYFQWGDTVGYTADQVGVDKVFNWDSYFDTTDGGSTFKKYNNNGGLTVLESSDDAAAVHTNSQLRMPTSAEIQELISGTTQSFIDLDGNEYSKEQAKNGAIESGKLKGIKFTSKTVKDDNNEFTSIFIPAAGYCGKSLNRIGVDGILWSSNLSDFSDGDARYLYFIFGGSVFESGNGRYFGQSVRGVHS